MIKGVINRTLKFEVKHDIPRMNKQINGTDSHHPPGLKTGSRFIIIDLHELKIDCEVGRSSWSPSQNCNFWKLVSPVKVIPESFQNNLVRNIDS